MHSVLKKVNLSCEIKAKYKNKDHWRSLLEWQGLLGMVCKSAHHYHPEGNLPWVRRWLRGLSSGAQLFGNCIKSRSIFVYKWNSSYSQREPLYETPVTRMGIFWSIESSIETLLHQFLHLFRNDCVSCWHTFWIQLPNTFWVNSKE